MKTAIHLVGDIYHFRHRVPCDLVGHFSTVGLREFRISLKTGSEEAAKRVSSELIYILERLFDALRLCAPERTRSYIESTRNPLLSRMLQMSLRRLARSDIESMDKFINNKASPSLLPVNHHEGKSSDEISLDPGEPLQKIVDQFIQRKSAPGGGWGVKCKLDRRVCLDVFVEIMAHFKVTGIKQITKQILIQYDLVIRQFPPNRNKIATLQKASIADLIEMFNRNEYQPIKLNTVRKHLSTVNSFFSWANDLDYTDISLGKILATSRKNIKRTKFPYEKKDVKRMMASPLYSDAASNVFDRARTHAERFFVPLILLHTGARSNEICQLYVDDVDTEGEIPLLRLYDDPRRLQSQKTGKQRIVPVHPALVEVGFLEYVRVMGQSGSNRVFPALSHSVNGFAGKFTSWFGRYNRQYIALDDLTKTAHSFRHTVADTLKNLGVQEQIIAELVGHETGSMTMVTYGQPYAVKILYEAICKLDFVSPHIPRLKAMAKKIYAPEVKTRKELLLDQFLESS